MPTLRRKKGTEKFVPVPCAHAAAEEGYREACPCHLCPRCDGRRAQRSLLLSSVPILRRKKGTEKLAPVTCAHAVAEEGHREACSCHLCPRCGRRRVQEGVRRMTPKIKTVICEQAPNHGSYFSYARLCFRNFQFNILLQYQSLPARQLSCLQSRVFCGGMPASNRIRQFRHRLRCYPE